MKKTVAGVLVLAAMGGYCGVSYAAEQAQNSGKQDTVSTSGEKITPGQKPLQPKSHAKSKRIGKNWINPQPEPPGELINSSKHPNPHEKVQLNPQPEPPKPPDPTINK